MRSLEPSGKRLLLRSGIIWTLSALFIVVLTRFLSGYVPLDIEGPVSVPELVSSFGVSLASLGIAPWIPKETYLHLLHVLVLTVLAGQLWVAFRQESEAYLSAVLVTCGFLTVSYGLYAAYGLWRLGPVANPTQPPGPVLLGLSVLSSLSLFLAGYAANPERCLTFSAVRSLLGLATLLVSMGVLLVIRFEWLTPLLRPTAIAATSVTSCIVCAEAFFKRARPLGKLLATTLGGAFGIYAAVHLFEPLLYGAGSKYKELVFLFGFVSKSIALLALVALSLSESHHRLQSANTDLNQSNHKLMEEQRVFSELLTKTAHAFYRDDLDGRILSQHGEQEILGQLATQCTQRLELFVDESEYRVFRKELETQERVRDMLVQMRHATGAVKWVRMHAYRRHDGTEFIEGFYHDVTEEEQRKGADVLIEHVIKRAGSCKSTVEAMVVACSELGRRVNAEVFLYLNSGGQAGSRPLQLAAASGMGGGLAPRELNLNLEEQEATNRRAGIDSDEFGQRLAQLLQLGRPFSWNLLRGREAGRLPLLGVVITVFSEDRGADRGSYVEVLGQRMEELVLGWELSFLSQLVGHERKVWDTLLGEADLKEALRTLLQAFVKGTDYESLNVITSASFRLPRQPEGLAVSSTGNVPLSLVQVMQTRADCTSPKEASSGRGLVVIRNAESQIAAAIPIVTAGQNVLGWIVATKNTERPTGQFHQLDACYLENLAPYLEIVLARARARYSFTQVVRYVGHDLHSPIAAIRDKTDHCLHHLDTLPKERIRDKLDDVLAYVGELKVLADAIEYQTQMQPRGERARGTLVFKHVIQKWCKSFHRSFVQREGVPPVPSPADFVMIPELVLVRSTLDRIVQNLLMNMVKYGIDSQLHRAPRIVGGTVPGYFVVCFRDWGMGVEEKEAGRIFEEAYRGRGATRKDPAGNGLGLFIARRLAEDQLKGRLELTNPREPTEFTIYIPEDLAKGRSNG